MTQAQFLLFLISIIPLANYFILSLCQHSQKLVNILSKFLPILFFLHLIGLTNSLNNNQVYIQIIEAVRGVSIGFMVDSLMIKFLFLLNFIWIIFVFYSHRFLRIENAKYTNQFQLFFAIAIAFINLILIAQNLLTTLFFYNCLVLLCHFFAVKFLHKKESRFSHIFTFLLYLESILFFFAVVATYKFSGKIDFTVGGILSENLNQTKAAILLIFYLGGLFLSMLLPSYLLHKNISLNPLIIYALFFVSYAFSSLYIFIKISAFIFGLSNFADIVLKIGFQYFELIFLANLLVSCGFLLFSKNLKSAFFYFFFNQFTLALFSIVTFATFDPARVYLPFFSFILSITLVFLCFSNLVLYLDKAQDKSLYGLFYDLKITSILLFFGLVNLSGLIPTIGLLEKFFLIKIFAKKKLFLGLTIYIINLATIVILGSRLAYLLFSKNESPKSEEDLQIAKAIDFDSSLILTGLITAIAIFLAVIFYPLLTNFFSI